MEVVIKRDYSLKVSSRVSEISTLKVCILINNNCKICVNKNDLVKIGSILAESDVRNIYSTVSGRVLESKKVINEEGKNIDAILILNDFKEQAIKFPLATNKEQLLNIIKDYNNELYYKLSKSENKKIIINIIEDEPYVANNVMILNYNIDKILDTLDELFLPFKFKEITIVVKSTDMDSIDKLWNKLGRYPQIHLRIIDDYYGYSNNDLLCNKLQFDKNKVCIFTLEELIIISNLLKKQTITTKKYITVSGNAVKNPKVVKAKIGTLVTEIITSKFKLRKDLEYYFIVNGLMKGKILDIENLVVTKDLNSIIINTIERHEIKECINCGLCSKVCPVNIDPRYIINLHKKNIKVSKRYINKCINCNLCTYICPSKIQLNKILEKGSDNK